MARNFDDMLTPPKYSSLEEYEINLAMDFGRIKGKTAETKAYEMAERILQYNETLTARQLGNIPLSSIDPPAVKSILQLAYMRTIPIVEEEGLVYRQIPRSDLEYLYEFCREDIESLRCCVA